MQRARIAEDPPDMLPHRIGRYDVSAELGRGSTSIVYKGVDPVDRRVVAIKTLQRNGADDDGDADSILLRFRNEARTIGRLRHPGVVAVDEFGEDGLHSWIAMEYVEGCNLDELLLRSPLLGQERAMAIMDELLDALGCVHRQGICHRDVKPANIMVTTAGRVKLTDFGVARLRDLGLTRVSSIIGTPAFMAPEQFTGGALDHRADLFACGVLLFLLLSGRRPFSGAPAAVMHQILNEEAPLLSEASGGLVGRAYDDVILRALAKRAEDRFSSAGDMKDALRAAALQAAESPLVTVVMTLVQDAGRPYGRMPAGDEPAPSCSIDERAWVGRPLAHPVEPMAHMVVREARGQARLVDALALYTPVADEPEALFDGPPFTDADGARPSAASSDPTLPPEVRTSVQQLLTRTLGPVAGLLVKRAADTAGGSRPAFIMNLLAEVSVPHRAALRAELEALLYPPQRTESGR
jgi:serine/threonine-protein kinase